AVFVLVSHMSPVALFAQMRQPDVTTLARVAPIIIRGNVVKIQSIEVVAGVSYKFITFAIEATYKADANFNPLTEVEIDHDVKFGKYINVIVETQSFTSERLPPNYVKGRSYLLFLNSVTEFLCSRIPMEDRYPEREWNTKLEREVKDAIQGEWRPCCPKGDK